MRADSPACRGLLAVLIALPLALHAAPAADPFTGEWEFQGDKPDPTTGNEEYLRIRLKLQDDGVVCGIFLSGWQGGRRIVEGFLRGKARGNRIDEVTYDAGWAHVAGHGAAASACATASSNGRSRGRPRPTT